MAQKILNEWYLNTSLPQLILPIPLHPGRLRERGFNQALEIAKPLSNIIKLPIDSNSLLRPRATLAQSGLSATQRIENMKGAFSANSTLNGLHVALIDDVVTTGHTITAACLALKSAGVGQIDVWCCART